MPYLCASTRWVTAARRCLGVHSPRRFPDSANIRPAGNVRGGTFPVAPPVAGIWDLLARRQQAGERGWLLSRAGRKRVAVRRTAFRA
jgi:hypothetical protein